MKPHHESSLLLALDQIYLEGTTSVLWSQIYLWYNAERLRKSAYADIQERWEDLWLGKHPKSEVPVLRALSLKERLTLIRGDFTEGNQLWADFKDWT